MEEKTNIERLREAWANAPSGSKARMLEDASCTSQNILDILKNGRKDEAIILELLEGLKVASRSIVEEENEKNRKVQAI